MTMAMTVVVDRAGNLIADRYELIERIGEGGVAVVWLAKTHGAAGFSRRVAIKRLQQRCHGDPHQVLMFVEEARVGAQLHHPNIIQVNDFGIDSEGAFFMVMEWIDGIDFNRFLKAYQQRQQLAAWPVVVQIVACALDGLAAAHERPEGAVIHRDINPHNILLDKHGMPKISDFGFSRAADRWSITQPKVLKGKIAYTAPELTKGLEASVGSDLFSMGIVLWEALAGRWLFDGDSWADIAMDVRKCRVPLLHHLRRDLPLELCDVVHRSLLKAPARRFASAYEMARALRGVLGTVDAETWDARAAARCVRAARGELAGGSKSIEISGLDKAGGLDKVDSAA